VNEIFSKYIIDTFVVKGGSHLNYENKNNKEPDMVAHVCNPSTQEAEARES
jgi:hypothetical protein